MSLPTGSRIGVYEIEAAIGAGGMGVVYRARDTKLGRGVAIKMLPDVYADSADRVARFVREAQILAALNHPHIAQIYGLEDRALVMELVDGLTLANRLASGPLPVSEALSIARQIADALQAAHDKGIVHRDLKPGNIALTADNTVKVLDFGLAKLTEPEASGPTFDVTQSPTITSPAMMTGTGMVLGTAAYMSPEQAKGRAVDKRTDIWAFGCVLYEMLTGARPFAGEDVSDTFAFVLTKEPDWSALPADVPPAVRTLLDRCLTKDVRQRAADISLARFLLEPQSTIAVTAPEASHRSLGRERAAWAVAAVAGLFAAALAVVHFREPSPPPPVSLRFSVAPPPGTSFATAVVSGGGVLSPDGRSLVFPVTPRIGTVVRLAIHQFDTMGLSEMPGTEGAIGPFWSPDSRFVAFLASGKLQRVDITGGLPEVICAATGFAGGAWGRDGTIVFASETGPLLRVSSRGGQPVAATALDASRAEVTHRYPSFLPDGRHFLFVATRSTGESMVHLGSLDSTVSAPLVASDTRAAYADGYLLFMSQSTLLAQPFDVGRLTLSDEPVAVARNVASTPATVGSDFSTSTTGMLSFRNAGGAVNTQLAWIDRSGRLLERVGTPGDQTSVNLSPDGKRLAVSVFDAAKQARDIWIHDLVRDVRTRFTLTTGDHWDSTWSPDGTRLAFSSTVNGLMNIFVKDGDGAGADVALGDSGDNNRYVRAWSPDGRALLYVTGRSRSQTGNDVWILPLEGDRAPKAFLQTRFNEDDAVFSPDGRWVSYTSDESGRSEIYVTPYPGPGGKWQVSRAGGIDPRWTRNGESIVYLEGSAVMEVAVRERGGTFEAGTPQRLFEARFRTENYLGYGSGRVFDVSPDGQRFLVDVVEGDAAQAPITVVTNWTSLLPRR